MGKYSRHHRLRNRPVRNVGFGGERLKTVAIRGPEPTSEREYLVRVYDVVNELRGDMGELKTAIKEQNGRVQRLEEWRWKMGGGLAIVGVLATAAAGMAMRVLWGGAP